MRRLILCCLLPLATAFAAVDGTIVNGTTGQPEPNTVVLLIQPTQAGMQTLGTTKSDAQGKFSFDNNDDSGPRLIQAVLPGVQYNKMVPPGTPFHRHCHSGVCLHQQSRNRERDAALHRAPAG